MKLKELPQWPLIALMFGAPWIGVRKRWPSVLHAVTYEGLPIHTWPDGLATSACGLTGLRILASGENPVAWPPRVAGLAESSKERCRACWEATGRKRPRSTFKPNHGQQGGAG